MAQVGNNKKLMSDINVTPFVDVMLVLLIIFMVTAPLMMPGVEVNLPKTTTKHIKTDDQPLLLTIKKNREIFIEDHQMELDDLEYKIMKIFENRREKKIILRADKDVSHGFVVKVMAGVNRAGIEKLSIATEPED